MITPKCSICGRNVPRAPSFKELEEQQNAIILTLDDFGVEYDEPVFQASVCKKCGRIYCFSCHDKDAKGISCPHCGHGMHLLGEYYLRKKNKKWWQFWK